MSHKTPKPFYPLNIAILTVSDTRTLADDTSGQYLEDAVCAAGHHLAARTLRQLKTDNEIATLDALIADSAALLRQHFGKPDDPHGNELPDNPVIID